jgi:hypothetical protein
LDSNRALTRCGAASLGPSHRSFSLHASKKRDTRHNKPSQRSAKMMSEDAKFALGF